MVKLIPSGTLLTVVLATLMENTGRATGVWRSKALSLAFRSLQIERASPTYFRIQRWLVINVMKISLVKLGVAVSYKVQSHYGLVMAVRYSHIKYLLRHHHSRQ